MYRKLSQLSLDQIRSQNFKYMILSKHTLLGSGQRVVNLGGRVVSGRVYEGSSCLCLLPMDMSHIRHKYSWGDTCIWSRSALLSLIPINLIFQKLWSDNFRIVCCVGNFTDSCILKPFLVIYNIFICDKKGFWRDRDRIIFWHLKL